MLQPDSTHPDTFRRRPRTAAAGPAPPSLGRFFLLAATLYAICVPHLMAQFERTYGGADLETGISVDQTLGGGYVTAGYSMQGSIIRPYLVRTDANGDRIWDRRYELGAGQSAWFSSVKQCANGDYIAVGTVSTANAGCAGGCLHILALRTDQNGKVLWHRTYGDGVHELVGHGVVEAQVAPGPGTSIGDIVIVGTSSAQQDGNQGLLMRITSDGAVIWAKTYHPNPASQNVGVHLFSVDEARVDGSGDIIATGELWYALNNFDVPYLRVSGATGTVGLVPQGLASYGLSNNDYGRSIVELRNGQYRGDVVITGNSYSRPIPSATHEVVLVQARPDPNDPLGTRADRFYGDNGGYLDFGYCVREITDGANGTVGNVMVAGVVGRTPLNQNHQAFMQEFTAGTLVATGAMATFGGGGGEAAYGLTEAVSALGPAGFTFTGITNSASPGYANNDLYLVKKDPATPTCTQSTYTASDVSAGLQYTAGSPTISTPLLSTMCGVRVLVTTWANDLCQLGVMPKREAAPEFAQNAAATLLTVPNPSEPGAPVRLLYSFATAGTATLSVSDALGRIVFEKEIEHDAGNNEAGIATDGLPAGTYFVRAVSGSAHANGRFVLSPR